MKGMKGHVRLTSLEDEHPAKVSGRSDSGRSVLVCDWSWESLLSLRLPEAELDSQARMRVLSVGHNNTSERRRDLC